jgi:hypothetical protein
MITSIKLADLCECLNMKSPADVPPFQDDEISNDFLREEEEQQMECDDKNHEVQEDFDTNKLLSV